MKVESGNNCVCVVHWSAKTETTQDLENILLPSQTVTGLIETGLFLLVFWKKISLSCYRNADAPLLKKMPLHLFLSGVRESIQNVVTLMCCINLPDPIRSNKNCLKNYAFTNPFWSDQRAKNPSSKIFMIVTHGVVQARCPLYYQIFSLQVANKLVMCDIKRHKTIILCTSAVNKRTHCLLS